MTGQKKLFETSAGSPGWWTLHSDGAARGNPGPAGAGAVLRDPEGLVLAELSQPLGVGTNNEAEYQGLLLGLNEALRLGADKVHLFLDSELVVRQILGVYRVKNQRLKPLYDQAMALLQRLEAYDIVHVRRELNSEADRLASQAARRNG